MTAFYNENAPYAAQWLRNLVAADHIAKGVVDERSIVDVTADDCRGAIQAHFFAGIGGWPYALQLAGWPDDEPVWTGSCPCQPFSSASHGRSAGFADERDLWPIWRQLIATVHPRTLFGEQVATAYAWHDRLCNDLEALGYAVGTAIIPACSVGQDHVRARFYFVGHANSNSEPRRAFNAKASRLPGNYRDADDLAGTHGVSSRVGQLHAYGNAVVPQVAATFIRAVMDVLYA